MEQTQETQTTLREDLAANLESIVGNDDASQSAAQSDAGITDSAVIGETAEQRDARQRDEKGRFAKGSNGSAAQAPDADTVKPTGDLAPPQEKPKPQRPSTWKKDHWESFDKLAAENPALAEYINQRESEYARGVSTYKNEADRAREIWGAIEPFMPDLQRHNIAPAQWIGNLGRAHQTLAMGNPQQKIQMFAKLAQDYGVPLQALAPQQIGQDGQPMPQQALEPFLQFVNPLYEQVNQLKGQLHNWQTAQEQQKQNEIQSEIKRFSADKPHFEQVKDTMAGLLQSGLAQDLDSAYQAAVRMPQHDDIFQAMQQQQRQDKERQEAESRRANATRARNQTVSSRSGAPTAPASKGNGQSGLREALSEAFDAHATGRV